MAKKLKLRMARLSFPDLFTAVQFDGEGEYRYGASFFIEKGSENDKAIEAAILEVATAEHKTADKAKKFIESIRGNSNKFCYTDGDKKTYNGAEGHMVLSARRKQKDGRPGLFRADKSVIEEDNGELYSGCYVVAIVEVWCQDGKYPGVRCSLVGVQFLKDGDSFSGASRASADDFDTEVSNTGEDDGELA